MATANDDDARKRVCPDPTARTGVALVGYGPMGALHASNVYADPATTLLYIVGSKPESAEGNRLAHLYSCKYSSDLDAVLSDPAVSAVVVATPLATHYQIVASSLRAGKAVMCEKPLADTPERIDELYALSESCQVPLFTAFHRRFDTNFRYLKDNLSKAGTVELIRCVSLDPMEPSADVSINEARTRARMYDSLLHDFDMVAWLLGEQPSVVQAVQTRYDAIQVVLKHPSGVLAVIEWGGGTSFGYDQRVEVHGTGGRLCVENPPSAAVSHVGLHNAGNEPVSLPRGLEFFNTRYPAAYLAELKDFVSHIRAASVATSVTRAEAVGSARTADRAVASIFHSNPIARPVAVPATLRPAALPAPAVAAATKNPAVLGIALVGCGRMGSIRAERMSHSKRVKLLWVVDVDIPRASVLAQQYGAKVTASIDEALADPAVGGVWISTPSNLHLPVIKAAAAAKRAVFTEKPVALTVDDIDAAYAITKAEGVPLCCGWNRRSDPHFLDLQRRVQSAGDRPKSLLVNNGDHPLAPVSVLLQLGSLFHDFSGHDLDAAVWLTGEFPTALYALGNNFIPEMKQAGLLDAGLILLTFPSGVIAALSGRRCAVHGYDQRIEVFGMSGNLYRAVDPMLNATETHSAAGVQQANIHYTFADRYARAYGDEVEHFADVVLDGATPRTSHLESKAVALLADACVESEQSGRVVVFQTQ